MNLKSESIAKFRPTDHLTRTHSGIVVNLNPAAGEQLWGWADCMIFLCMIQFPHLKERNIKMTIFLGPLILNKLLQVKNLTENHPLCTIAISVSEILTCPLCLRTTT